MPTVRPSSTSAVSLVFERELPSQSRTGLPKADPLTESGLEAWERSPVVNGVKAGPVYDPGLRDLGAFTNGLLEGYAQDGDLRRLNLALKVRDLGHSCVEPHHGRPSGQVWESALEMAEAQVTDALQRLAQAPGAVVDCPSSKSLRGTAIVQDHGLAPLPAIPIAVLCSRGSSTAALFLAGRRAVARVACYDGTAVGHGIYASAWVPPDTVAEDTSSKISPDIELPDWGAVASWFDNLPKDIPVGIFGMPVIPPRALEWARGAVFNAHNGQLPGMRGLDSLAWALSTGAIPTATAHRVVADVDAGPVCARVLVPPFPTATLRRRMKVAQVTSLEMALSSIPAPRFADVPSVYYGRMHPALRWLLSGVLDRRRSCS